MDGTVFVINTKPGQRFKTVTARKCSSRCLQHVLVHIGIFTIKFLISKDERMSETELCGRRYTLQREKNVNLLV
jgi:hypothetical protein